MKIITAVGNKKINEQLQKINNIQILNPDIQYKEGILEYLEKNQNVDIIFMSENLLGQIMLNELLEKIKKINNKIKIFIFILKENKGDRPKIKNVEYIFLEKISTESILEILNIKNNSNTNKQINKKVIKIIGNRGSGKTVIAIIIAFLLSENKNVLLITNENLLFNKNIKNTEVNLEKEIIKYKNNFYLLNNQYFKKEKIKTIKYLEKIKNNFNFILIDNNDLILEKEYEKITNQFILLLEPNLLEIKKSKKLLQKEDINIILNKVNIYSIDSSIIEKIKNQKIIGKIKYMKNIHLFINHEFKIEYIHPKEKNNILKIIQKI